MKRFSAKTIQTEKQESIIEIITNDSNIEINAQDNKNRTILWWAVYFGKTDLVKFLLDKNADPTIVDCNEIDSLHLAEQKHNSLDNQTNPYLTIIKMLRENSERVDDASSLSTSPEESFSETTGLRHEYHAEQQEKNIIETLDLLGFKEKKRDSKLIDQPPLNPEKQRCFIL